MVISELVMRVVTTDSYRPARLTIRAGPSGEDLSVLDTITCSSVRRGDRIPILSDCSEHYPVVRICIEADGINCRINGILVTCIRSRSSASTLAPRSNPYGNYVLMRENMVNTGRQQDQPCFALLVRKLLCILTSRHERCVLA